MNTAVPTESDAQAILRNALGLEAVSIRRFPTGLANWVYDASFEDGSSLVVRLTQPDRKANFEGAQHWYGQLVDRGVPLPALHYAQLDETVHGFPVMVMDRLLGTDLGDAYAGLNEDQKKGIARRLADIQRAVSAMPPGKGFGYAKNADDPALLPSLHHMIESSLSRSQSRMRDTGIFPPKMVERVRAMIGRHSEYISRCQPVCYLDDTTTKNVIIHEGSLSGIVDVDWIAFGDPLFALALTNMALISRRLDTNYVGYWLDAMGATEEQREVMKLYTAVYCLDFMSEMGMAFNKDEAEPVSEGEIERFLGLLESLL